MVMYAYKYSRPVRKKRRKTRLGLIIVSLLLILSITILSIRSNNNTSELTSAEQQASVAEPSAPDDLETDRLIASSPLNAVVLPTVGFSAVGTASLGTIKSTPGDIVVPIASITKVITALVVLEKQPMVLDEQGDTITLTLQDEQYYHDYLALDGTLAPVTAGLDISQYDALQAILLASANNMADTLRDRYFASNDEYLEYANNYLRRNGLLNTQVADTTGFSPESKSSPSDLIKLGQLALQNPVIKQIVAKPRATIAIAGEIPNYNPFSEYPSVIGIKPGATEEAGYTLLFAAELPTKDGGTETMIGAVLGYENRKEYIQAATTIIEQSRELLLQ